MNDKEKEEQTNPEENQEDVNPETNQDSNADQDDEKDDKGVSYKNRAAEAQRKLQQKEDEIEEMKLRLQEVEQRVLQPKPNQPVSQDNKPQTQAEMNRFIELGPDKYFEEKQKVMQHQERMIAAENLIKEKFGADRLRYGVSKVIDYANKEMININADPIKAVTKILKDMDKPKKKELSNEDKKKAAEALKNKPESGKRTPPAPVQNTTDVDHNLKTRGSKDDAAAWLMERFKKE